MKSFLITSAAIVCALLTVLSTRLIVPALILIYRYIEAGFAPQEPVIAGVLPVSVAPLAVVSEPIEQRQDKPAPRKARRRKPSAKTLARAAEALA